MIENLSSKIDSLSDKTPLTANTKVVESDLTEPGPSSQREDIYELPQSLGQHITIPIHSYLSFFYSTSFLLFERYYTFKVWNNSQHLLILSQFEKFLNVFWILLKSNDFFHFQSLPTNVGSQLLDNVFHNWKFSIFQKLFIPHNFHLILWYIFEKADEWIPDWIQIQIYKHIVKQ